jgi:predicted RecA/RadA family phage recombinase
MALANQCIALFEPGDDITMVADASIAGCTLVAPKANNAVDITTGLQKCVQAAAAARPIGVLNGDAVQGNTRKVVRGNKVVPITAGAAIQSGQSVEVGAAGKLAVFGTGVVIGVALTNAANGELCYVAINL